MAIDLFSIGRFTVHGYGLMIGIGYVLAVLIGGYRTKKLGLSEEDFTNIAICVLIFGSAPVARFGGICGLWRDNHRDLIHIYIL